MSGLNPPSFRRPLNVDGKDPKQVAYAIRTLSNIVLDHMQAFSALGKSAGTAATSTTPSAAGVTGATQQIIQQTVINQAAPLAGFENNQAGVTAYTTQQSDYGGYVLLNDASPIAVTLNTAGTSPGIALPWYATFINFGAGTSTLTPATGTISYPGNIGAASMPIPQYFGAVVVFDGANFSAIIFPASPQSIAAVAHYWLNSYNSSTGAFTATQPAFTDISGQITTGQLPASGLSVTITTAKLTVGGTQGSMTFTTGILTTQVAAT